MATQKVSNLFDRFRDITQDDPLNRWLSAELVSWLNEAYIQIVTVKPEANSKRATVTLASGPYQNIDDTGSINLPNSLSLIKVVRNMGSNKRAIRYIPLAELDENIPDWPSEDETANIERWSFDPDIPREFMVYPPASVGTTIEIIYADTPGAHTDGSSVETEDLKLRDTYAPMILDYLLYRAYSKDADNASNAKRAAFHLQTFTAGFGAKNKADDEQAEIN